MRFIAPHQHPPQALGERCIQFGDLLGLEPDEARVREARDLALDGFALGEHRLEPLEEVQIMPDRRRDEVAGRARKCGPLPEEIGELPHLAKARERHARLALQFVDECHELAPARDEPLKRLTEPLLRQRGILLQRVAHIDILVRSLTQCPLCQEEGEPLDIDELLFEMLMVELQAHIERAVDEGDIAAIRQFALDIVERELPGVALRTELAIIPIDLALHLEVRLYRAP